MGPALPALAVEAASHLPLTAAVRSGAADAAKLIRNHLSPAVAHSSVRRQLVSIKRVIT
jgi:hypothetical protein